MADPDSKLTVSVGTRFLLSWSADIKAHVTNVFDLVDGTTKSIVGNKPGKNVAPRPVDIKLHITKDGEPYGFRVGVKDPVFRPNVAWTKNVFTSQFVAREEGVLLFTVELPNGATLTKEVTITPGAVRTAKRDYMLDLINRWMPTSVLLPRPPKVTNKEELARAGWPADRVPDLMELSNWTKAQVKTQQDRKAAGGGTVTSCGDVLAKMLMLWGCDWEGDGTMKTRAFGIRDDGSEKYVDEKDGKTKERLVPGKPPLGAVTLGRYQSATEAYAQDPPILPTPGDLVVLRDGNTTKATGVGHVGLIVSVSDEHWYTGDGGGGRLDAGEQSAEAGARLVVYTTPDATHKKGIPILRSVTDGLEKLVDGWVILDKIPNPLFDADGKWITPPAEWSDDEHAMVAPAEQPAEQPAAS